MAPGEGGYSSHFSVPAYSSHFSVPAWQGVGVGVEKGRGCGREGLRTGGVEDGRG